MHVTERVRGFVIDNFLFGEEKGFSDDASFLGEGIIDSTGIMELVAFVEREFSVMVHDDELLPENLDSISRLALFIERRLKAPSMGADEFVAA